MMMHIQFDELEEFADVIREGYNEYYEEQVNRDVDPHERLRIALEDVGRKMLSDIIDKVKEVN